MGIYNFHTWLREKYLGSYIHIKNNNIYEYIYIDVNFILHNSIYGCKTEIEFVNRLYLQLDIIFSNFIATKKIFFSLDGPSSFAKILLQRKRRTAKSNKDNKNGISSLYITPGIEPMKRIEAYLNSYITRLKREYNFNKPNIYISSSNQPDEGEIKICREVIKNGIENLNHRHLIIGNDSDLIVLSMGMKPIYNINILVRGKTQNELISLSRLLQLHSQKINRLDKIEILSNSTIRDDFVIVSIMMGNDYLPKLGYISYEKLWKLYYELIKNTPEDETLMNNNNTFNNNVFKRFLFCVYKNLPTGFKKVSINTYNETRATSYLEGLLWCLKMYNIGKCPKYNYAYIGNRSPHPYELLFHMCSITNIELENSEFKPISSEIYSLIIMPKKASYLIPVKYHTLINNELKYLYEVEECQSCIQYKENSNLLSKQIQNSDEYDPYFDLIKTNFKNNMNKYIKHKKIHSNKFGIDDIIKIIIYIFVN